MAIRWDFESDEPSSGPMFSVYDEHGTRITEPYISESAALLIAAAPELLAALEPIAASRRGLEITIEQLDACRAALHLAKHDAAPATTNEEAA